MIDYTKLEIPFILENSLNPLYFIRLYFSVKRIFRLRYKHRIKELIDWCYFLLPIIFSLNSLIKSLNSSGK